MNIRIPDKTVMRDRMVHVWNLVNKGIEGGEVVITLGRRNKSRDQEEMYHAILHKIARSVPFSGGKHYDMEVWKAYLVDKFETIRKEMGEPLRKPSRLVPSFDGQRMVTVRASTREFSVKEANDFIAFLQSEAAEMGVEIDH